MRSDPLHMVRSAWSMLRLTFVIVPIVSGIDKFTDLLTYWDKYLAPFVVRLLPINPHTFMLFVGVVEIVTGIIVMAAPLIGGYMAMVWLTAIAVDLVAAGFYDTAVRDLVMAVSALALARLSVVVSSD